MLKLNLGCGEKKFRDHINVDLRRNVRPDLICDVRALPFVKGIFDEIFMSHVIEHVGWRETYPFLSECVRVLKRNGIIYIVCPNIHSLRALRLVLFPKEELDEFSMGIFYGGQDYAENYHQACFSRRSLRKIFSMLGVMEISSWTLYLSEYFYLPFFGNIYVRTFYRKAKFNRKLHFLLPSWGDELHWKGRKLV